MCYSCTHYEDCHDKTATVTSCNAYKNRREAQKTDEERYNEEQAAIDRETRKKLREKQQEEKMQQLPSDGQQKQRDIRLTPQKYAEITAGKLTFLLLKKTASKSVRNWNWESSRTEKRQDARLTLRLFISGQTGRGLMMITALSVSMSRHLMNRR